MKILMIIFLFILSCNENQSSDVKPKSIVKIVENGNNVVEGISNLKIDEKSNLTYFTNQSKTVLYIADLSSGKILFQYTSSLALSDSFALSKHTPQKVRDKDWVHLTNKQFEELTGFDVKNKSIITNYLEGILNIDKQISVSCLAYCYKHSSIDPKETSIANSSILLNFDTKLNLYKVVRFEHTENSYPSTILEILSNGQFLNKNLIGYKGFYRSKDSLPAVSLYNSDGSFIKEIAYLPEFFYKKDIGYRLFADPKYTSFNEKKYIAYGYVEKIFCLDKKDTILLQNIDFSNQDKYDSLDREIGKGLKDFDYFGFFPNLIRQISLYQNELYVVLTKLTKTGDRDYVLQKYNIQNGRFVEEVNLNHLQEYTIYILPDHSKIYFAGLDEESEEYFISFMEL